MYPNDLPPFSLFSTVNSNPSYSGMGEGENETATAAKCCRHCGQNRHCDDTTNRYNGTVTRRMTKQIVTAIDCV